jgi:NAD(P)-dependent dehydrogenase (short-subunit alcohol dehydrogenase family)
MLVKDKVIIVSGIGPGLGVKLAIHAAIEGAAGVVVCARSPNHLDDAEERIRATGAPCAVLKQVNDIRKEDQCRATAEAAFNRFGRIDALINNAVFHGPLDFAETADLDSWHEQYDTNVIGTLKMSRAVTPQFRKSGGGSIVMINTMGSRMVPIVAEAGYCTSKAALYHATKHLAREIGKANIRVNTVNPGWMWGEPVRNHLRSHPEEWGTEEEAYAKVAAQMALPRIATDDECARAALFLASDYSSAITGASLDVNAGNYMP